MIYDNVGGIRDSFKQDLALQVYKKKESISIITEPHINHDQKYLIFFSPGDSHTKRSLVLLHPDLEDITEIETDPKEELVFFKVTPLPLIIEFSVFMPIQGIVPQNSWLGGVSLKDFKKMSEMKTK